MFCTTCLTFASLSLRACLVALSTSLPSISHACLASALDRLTTLSDSAGSHIFTGSSAGEPHNRFWIRRKGVFATVYHCCDGFKLLTLSKCN